MLKLRWSVLLYLPLLTLLALSSAAPARSASLLEPAQSLVARGPQSLGAPTQTPLAQTRQAQATLAQTVLAAPWCRNWYPDCDGDQDGDPAGELYTCRNPNWSSEPPACAYVRSGGDCDDQDPAVSSKAVEGPTDPASTTDGIDNDCDGYVDIDCDGTHAALTPRVELQTPGRGLYSASSQVTVSGFVLPGQERSPIAQVLINGVASPLQQCSADGGARFSAPHTLLKGEQTMVIQAIDLAGRSDRAMTSAIYTDRYLSVPASPVQGAATTLINQGSWNILGDWLESQLTAQELEAELLAANPLVQDSGDYDCLEKWEVYANATRYTHDDVEVGFTVTGGSIAVTARLVRPQIWATGWAYYDLEWYCGEWSDRVYMDAYASFTEVYATAKGTLGLNSAGQVTVGFTNVAVDARGEYLSVDADSSIYDWLLDIFEDDLANELEAFVEGELRDYVLYDLGPELAAELNSLDLSYTVDVEGRSYNVAFTYDALKVLEGGVSLGFKMGLGYTRDARTPSNLGAVGLSTAYTADVKPTFAFKFSADFFNAALHALWEGGSLYLTGTLLESPLTTGSATPLLAPVVTPGTSPYQLNLSMGDLIGDIQIATTTGTFSFQAAASTTVSVLLTPIVSGTTVTFDVSFSPAVVAYDVLGNVVIPAELQSASEAAMSELVAEQLVILEAYLESLELSYFDIPMNISSLKLLPDPANSATLSLDGQAVYSGK